MENDSSNNLHILSLTTAITVPHLDQFNFSFLVVILWTAESTIPLLLQAIKKSGEKNRFIFLGSDGWSGRRYSTEHNEKILEGAITVQPLADPIRGIVSDLARSILFYFLMVMKNESVKTTLL